MNGKLKCHICIFMFHILSYLKATVRWKGNDGLQLIALQYYGKNSLVNHSKILHIFSNGWGSKSRFEMIILASLYNIMRWIIYMHCSMSRRGAVRLLNIRLGTSFCQSFLFTKSLAIFFRFLFCLHFNTNSFRGEKSRILSVHGN